MDETTGTTPPAPEAPAPPPAAPPAPAPLGADMSGRPGPVSDTSKLLAALGYLIWIVALIALLI